MFVVLRCTYYHDDDDLLNIMPCTSSILFCSLCTIDIICYKGKTIGIHIYCILAVLKLFEKKIKQTGLLVINLLNKLKV